MSTVFPPRAFKPEEIVDPAWLDKTYQPIAEKIYGRINEQDISSGAFDIAKVYQANGTWSYDKGAYTNKWLDVPGTQNPGFGAAVSGASPNGWFLNGTQVDYSVAWQTISSMSVSVTTGEDVLWIVGMTQYATFKGTGSTLVSPTAPSEDEARVQFAIRVDGAIINETITGSSIFPDPSNQMLYKGRAVSQNYDYRHVRHVQNGEGIGGAAKPVRLTYAAPVVEGEHLVEVVVRRLPQGDGNLDNDQAVGPNLGSEVRLYNKQLFVLACNAYGDTTATMSASGVNAFAENEVLSQASLFTNRLSVVANRMNSLPSQSVERGALRRTHLPRAATNFDFKSISDNDPKTYTQVYDNFNDDTNWETVQTGSGTLLRIDNLGGGWNIGTYPGWLIIMANVNLWDISQSTHLMRTSVMGCFTIRIWDGSAYHNVMGGLTEVYCTNDSFYLSGPGGVTPKATTDFAYEDVPLFLAVDTAALAADIGGNIIEYIEVSVAGWRGANPGFSDLKTNGGFLSAWIQER